MVAPDLNNKGVLLRPNSRWLTDHVESMEAFLLYESITLVIPTIIAAVYFWRRRGEWW